MCATSLTPTAAERDAVDEMSRLHSSAHEPSADHSNADHHHSHSHSHEGERGSGGFIARLWARVLPHSHDSVDSVDSALESSAMGIRAVKVSLVALGVTALLQVAVVLVSGSVALLADTIHNVADALTAVPLWVAFALSRRAPSRRFTYGYGRMEDAAGLFIVVMIAASAVLAGWEAIDRLEHPAPVEHLGWVAVAGLIGFAGNELVARYRITVGRRIGSGALIADGQHARTDGFTSLAVVASAAAIAMGWPAADPIIGLLITLTILGVLVSAARGVFQRLLDGVDPSLTDAAQHALQMTPGVLGVTDVRLRWLGHTLRAEADVVVGADLSAAAAHEVAHLAEESLVAHVPNLDSATIHTSPAAQPAASIAPHPEGLS